MSEHGECRGKRVDGKGWVYGWYCEQRICKPDGMLYLIHATDKTYEVIPESVGQGTGKCVGGTEIFNGDILRSFHFKDKHGKKHYLYHQVRWSPTYLSWMVCAKGEQDKPEDNRQGSPPLWVYLKNSLEVEVIGNTTDNPKLLEQENE